VKSRSPLRSLQAWRRRCSFPPAPRPPSSSDPSQGASQAEPESNLAFASARATVVRILLGCLRPC
jgi:hypothetical protein